LEIVFPRPSAAKKLCQMTKQGVIISMAMDEYYIDIGGETFGPFTLETLREMKRSGEVNNQTIYCQPGATEWLPLYTLNPLLDPSLPVSPSPPPRGPGPFSRLRVAQWTAAAFGLMLLIAVCNDSSPSGRAASDQANAESAVKLWLDQNLNDPDSLRIAEWSPVHKARVSYFIRCKYRAKNGFGGYVAENKVFRLSQSHSQ